MDFEPRGFLDKNDVELALSLENGIDDEGVFLNVLQKNSEIFYNHSWGSLFSKETINLDLFSQISEYFFCYHSLLNLCLQNGHRLESAWWSPWQFEHLNKWGHGSSFFISSREGLDFSFALQHHLNSQWFSDLWGPLHLTYLDPCTLHEKVAWPHFQQFLH